MDDFDDDILEKKKIPKKRMHDSDDEDEDVGSVKKKHRVQNFDNFLDNEAVDDDIDDDDPNISLSKSNFSFILILW